MILVPILCDNFWQESYSNFVCGINSLDDVMDTMDTEAHGKSTSSHGSLWLWFCFRGPLEPMDCSPPGSSVHGILQARILERVVIPFSRGSSWPRDQHSVFCIAGRFFTVWDNREAFRLDYTIIITRRKVYSYYSSYILHESRIMHQSN